MVPQQYSLLMNKLHEGSYDTAPVLAPPESEYTIQSTSVPDKESCNFLNSYITIFQQLIIHSNIANHCFFNIKL